MTSECVLLLSLLEIMHLGFKKLKKGILDYYPHLKDDLDDYYSSKSKKNSVVHQVCMGTSVSRKTTIPTAPCGYTLLLEKQGNGPTYPPFNASSAFVPIQGDPGAKPDGHKDAKESVPSPTEQNSNSNNTSSETRSPPADKQDEPEERASPRHPPAEGPGSEYPTLPAADASSCPALSAVGRRPRRLSPPWNCSTLVEGNGSDSDSFHGSSSMKLRSCVGPRARLLSRSDIKRASRPQSPDSAGELSSVSRHSRDSNSPTASSPNRRVSAASSSSSRRAATDLQI